MRLLRTLPVALSLALLTTGVLPASADDLEFVTESQTSVEAPEDGWFEDTVIRDVIRELSAPEIIALARELAGLTEQFEQVLDIFDPVADGLALPGTSMFPDPSDLPATEGGDDHGLPADAPPSGWVFSGIASLPQFGRVTDTGSDLPIPSSPAGRGEIITSHRVGDNGHIIRTIWQGGGNSHTLTTLYVGGKVVYITYNKNGVTRIILRGPAWEHRGSGPDVDTKPSAGDGKPVEGGSGEQDTKPGDKETNPGDGMTATEQEWAEWLWRQHQSGRTASAQTTGPNRVNPDDPEYSADMPISPSIWDYLDDNAIVGNPDPDGGKTKASAPSELAWSIMRQLLRAFGQGVTPGGSPQGPDNGAAFGKMGMGSK